MVMSKQCCCSSAVVAGDHTGVHLTLPLSPSFSLENTVCSYGFFMTAPNSWTPNLEGGGGGTLQRPLRLVNGQAIVVRIIQMPSSHCAACCVPSDQSHQAECTAAASNLIICLRGVHSVTDEDKDCILAQVIRMLRLSKAESSSICAFQELHPVAKDNGFGRLFRSPTLFEDMVKSLLLCNCGWGRTLAMIKALCELQAELKGPPLGLLSGYQVGMQAICHKPLASSPATPECKDLKRKRSSKKSKACRPVNFPEKEEVSQVISSPQTLSPLLDMDTPEVKAPAGTTVHAFKVEERNVKDHQQKILFAEISQSCPGDEVVKSSESEMGSLPCCGAFPAPEELGGLDVNFLSKRCGLGYRAKRIWKLARDICDGTLDLESLERKHASGQLQAEGLRAELLQLQGFGPFTCANVMMCMGEYGTVSADTETVRHLQQMYGRSSCTIANVSRKVAEVYAQYAPFQFLAYWFELWGTYEKRFGPLSRMAPGDYGLITGHNMVKVRT